MILFFFIFSFLYSIDSQVLLDNLYNQNNWKKYSKTEDSKKIFDCEHSGLKYIKVVKKVVFSKKQIFEKIKSINNYNEIISNENVTTKLVLQEKDTLYGYQKISNSIPFVRDRQYIFKMYQKDDYRLDWYIIDKNSDLLKSYIDDEVHTISYGAGSWYFKDDTLTNRIYVDDGVNLPINLLHKIRINHVTQIFDDVLNNLIIEEK